MRKLKEQLTLAKAKDYDNNQACSGAFTAKFGMSCKHYLHEKTRELRDFTSDEKAVFIIKMSLIDQHWFLDPPRAKGEDFAGNEELFRPLDPLKVKSKGRPEGSTTKTLKKLSADKRNKCESRDLSSWEHTQATQQSSQGTSGASKPPKKRIYKKKTTTTVVVESELSVLGITKEMLEMFRGMVREEIGVIKEQMEGIQASQERQEPIQISSSSEEEMEMETDMEDEVRSSDEEFSLPKATMAVKSDYTTQSKGKTPAKASKKGKASTKAPKKRQKRKKPK
ncbi:hypothetical protein EK21DRAFT_108939 [Setomelanomma holmii]|uniref:Uncharacterized protein n=1 Tax=Setomelanomma holmii TaxID=210430 RepID=A0A9P4HHQ8_9PLEO|nr:hypothetical protein EK21DRAFT_108939 [Setomelanomma holmii]